MILVYFCAMHKVQDADNATALRMWSDDKLSKIYETN